MMIRLLLDDAFDLCWMFGKQYEKAKQMLEMFFSRCSSNPLVQFVDGHLKFPCGLYGPAFMGMFFFSLALTSTN
ncbi:hypothetical protein OESDEN_02528 [Oesophagostomum dentatum]|uniref:Uncharacterized protein n=1 Tax=Oesophagostomum dentatum TaxID=61180 RepID=A0A0B1TIW5_OESDE|nr:hypothetical protein OESDEN_02528 [Oesophagostomum dentatum]